MRIHRCEDPITGRAIVIGMDSAEIRMAIDIELPEEADFKAKLPIRLQQKDLDWMLSVEKDWVGNTPKLDVLSMRMLWEFINSRERPHAPLPSQYWKRVPA